MKTSMARDRNNSIHTITGVTHLKRHMVYWFFVLAVLSLTFLSCRAAQDEGEPSQQRAPQNVKVVKRQAKKNLGSGPRIGVRRLPPRDNGDPGMLEAMLRAIGDSQGKIAYLGVRDPDDRRFGDFEKRIVKVDPEAFFERNSEKALKSLKSLNASFLLVSALDPEIPSWPSHQDNRINDLLRDGIAPPNFQPLVIGRAHILYKIGPSLEISGEQKKAITTYLRAHLTGEPQKSLVQLDDQNALSPDGKARVILSLRTKRKCSRGREIIRSLGEGENLRAALDHAAERTSARWPGRYDRSRCSSDLPSDLDSAMDHMNIEVEVIHRMAEITDRTTDRLYYLVELGREGVYLKHDSDTFVLSNNLTIHRAFDDEHSLVKRLGRWNKMAESAWQEDENQFGRFETLAWHEKSPRGPLQDLYRGVPLVRMNDVTQESVVQSLVYGAQYLARNQTKAGEYLYNYRPLRREDDRWVKGNNIVRHSLCPLVVLRAHQLSPDPELLASAKRGINYTLSFLRRNGDRCSVWHRDEGTEEHNAKMGTVAAMVISIIELSKSESIDDYRDELECLANQLIAMQEESGRFTHYDVPAGHPFYGLHNTIFPGEMMLALSRLYEFTGNERYKAAFDRAMDYQITWFARTSAETTDDNIYDERRRVDLISFEPWGIMAMEDMFRQTNDERYEEFGFDLVNFMDGRFQFDLSRAQYPDYLGGYFKTQLELPAINSCGYTEGAAAAYGIALRSGNHVDERRRALLFGLRYVLQLQYHPDRSLFYVPDRETTQGGFRYNLSFSRVRNDYMYHALNALALAAVTLRTEDYPPSVEFPNVPEILAPAFSD